MNTQKIVFNKLFKEDKTQLSVQKVELADDVKKLLSYSKGVNLFGKNIDIGIKEIEDSLNSLKVDREDLISDLNKVNKGLNLAEKMAKELGVNVSQIPNYNDAKSSVSYAEKQLAKSKKYN